MNLSLVPSKSVNSMIRKSRGFTLIELLVVISIIAILSAIAAASYSQIQRGARDTQRKSDLRSMASVLERFYSDNGYYPPPSSPAGSLAFGPDCDDTTSTIAFGSTTTLTCSNNAGNTITYFKGLPGDPLPGHTQYCYDRASTQRYTLAAILENTNDKEVEATTCNGSSGYNFNVTPTK